MGLVVMGLVVMGLIVIGLVVIGLVGFGCDRFGCDGFGCDGFGCDKVGWLWLGWVWLVGFGWLGLVGWRWLVCCHLLTMFAPLFKRDPTTFSCPPRVASWRAVVASPSASRTQTLPTSIRLTTSSSQPMAAASRSSAPTPPDSEHGSTRSAGCRTTLLEVVVNTSNSSAVFSVFGK